MLNGKNLLIILAPLSLTVAHAQRAPLDMTRVVGVETCADCHEEMVDSWSKSAHAKSFEELIDRPNAAEMAAILKIDRAEIPVTASCVRCHYTQEFLASVPQTTAGVSCESCHGPAIDWIEEHNRKTLSRSARVETGTRMGMVHPENIHLSSKACYECHVIDDEQLVNMAGHPAISDGFEILSWYSGEVKHNFLVNEGGVRKGHSKAQQDIPLARQRMLFLNGKLLHLSYTLRAIASSHDPPVDKSGNFIRLSTGRYTYSVQHAIELKRLTEDLRMILKNVSVSQFTDALAIVRGLSLETGNSKELEEASASIMTLSEKFCEENDGSKLGGIDGMISRLKPKFSRSEE